MRRRLADARGFSLIELLVAMSIFAVALVAILTLYDVASNDAANEQERNVSLLEQTAGVDRIARELRETYQYIGPTSATSSDYIDVLARLTVPGVGQLERRIIYDCTGADPTSVGLKRCVRYVSPTVTGSMTPGVPPPGAQSSVVLSRVLNDSTADAGDPLFQSLSSPSGSASRPTYGQIVLHTPGAGSRTKSSYLHQVVINDSFYMRDLDFGR